MKTPFRLAPAIFLALSLPSSTPGAILLYESFDPPTNLWTTTSSGSGAFWSYDLAGCQMSGNYTGGSGEALCANSDSFPGPYDASVISPVLDLSGAGNVVLTYRINYQNYSGQDTLDLDISTDGGSTWLTLLHWQEDHGAFQATPGELVTVNLTPYASPQTRFRWRYYDLSDAWDWYVQIDDVLVQSQQEPAEIPEPASFLMTAAGLGFLLMRKFRH